jgi:tRNA-specific 2-thiouridylase
MSKEKVVVAMSGGIDSTVTAHLIKKMGYDVIGITLRLLPCDDSKGNCCGIDGEIKARYACSKLDAPHYIVNCSTQFKKDVLEKSWEFYKKGMTPNPCAYCNESIKFGFLLDWASSLGISKIASGHYAIIESRKDHLYKLSRAYDKSKDQSYFLARLKQNQLERILFPLGKYTKTQIKSFGKDLGLIKGEIIESQDACFNTTDSPYAEVLRVFLKEKSNEGSIFSEHNELLKNHSGSHFFTIGQSKGLSLHYHKKMFVQEITKNHDIIVTEKRENLIRTQFFVFDFRFLASSDLLINAIKVQTRYRSKAVSCNLEKIDETNYFVHLEEAIDSISPGQLAVFYHDEEVIASGFIAREDNEKT